MEPLTNICEKSPDRSCDSHMIQREQLLLTTARHLEKVVCFKLLENTSLQLHKVVGDHDG